MGKKNNAICNYLENPERFADFLNGSLYEGKHVISPEQVEESQTVYSKEARSRDILKKICRDKNYILIGLENQDMVHYAMPLRCMEYDVLEYKKQLKQIKAKYQKKRTKKAAVESAADTFENTVMSKAEFLSGMRKEDKLNPVITIVFYHGEEEYDGCRNLHDMLNFEKENEIFKQYISDYQINLVTLMDLDENNFQTGVRELIAFLKRRTSKAELRKYCMENEQRLQEMDEDTFETIGIMLNKSDLIERKESCRQEGGKLNMCKAMEEWGEDLRQEGREQGREQGIKAFVWENMDEMVPEVRIVEKLQKYFGLDEESARNYFVRYEKECLSTP